MTISAINDLQMQRLSPNGIASAPIRDPEHSPTSTFASQVDRGYSNLEAVHDPDGEGIEVDGDGKQFHAQDDKEVNWYGKETNKASSELFIPKRRKICGLSRKLLLPAITILLLVCLALGLGLGFGIRKVSTSSKATDQASDTSLSIGGAIDPSYYSSKGAYNGTGIAFATMNDHGIIIFFQHWTGDIRWMELDSQGKYVGGTLDHIISTDARNSTAISAAAFTKNGTWNTHIFYVGDDGYLKQKFFAGNVTSRSSWQNGPLTGLKLPPLNDERVALQACWYDGLATDDDGGILGSASTNSTDLSYGMHLWYASGNATIEQYGWAYGTSQWTYQQSWFNMNVHAGVGCYSWGPGSVSYAMFVNLNNTLEIWWKDVNTSSSATSTHPINVWSNATGVAVPGMYPSTSLSYTNFLYAQLETGYIKGYNISFDSENTTVFNDITISNTNGPIKTLNGTHFDASAIPNHEGGDALYSLAQTEGDDITAFARDYFGGQWTSSPLPIPD